MEESGKLYLVGTPIGNLRDITLRAIDVLGKVDVIAAEDTRTSMKLLSAYSIRKPLVSYRGFKEKSDSKKIIEQILSGKDVALISEAGMPGLSDPGYLVVLEAIKNDVEVIAVPGPSAAITALIVSGLSTDTFLFEGFLPAKKGARIEKLKNLSKAEQTLIFYESPRRIIKFIEELIETMGDRQAAIAREMTKKFEEVIRGKLSHIKEELSKKETIKGEFVVLVSGVEKTQTISEKEIEQAREKLEQLLKMGLSRRDGAKITQLFTGINKKHLY